MKTKNKTGILILLTMGQLCFGQADGNTEYRKYGFQLGVSSLQVKEATLNGLVHSGPGLTASFSYENHCRKFLQEFEINAGMNFLQTQFETEKESFFLRGNLQYGIYHKLSEQENNSELFLGGMLNVDASQGIYSNWDFNHFYWLTAYGVGPRAICQFHTGKGNILKLSFGLPLLSLTSRVPRQQYYHEAEAASAYILKSIHRDPGFQWAGGHFNPEFKAGFQWSLDQKLSLRLFWKLNYTQNRRAGFEELKIVNNTFGMGLRF